MGLHDRKNLSGNLEIIFCEDGMCCSFTLGAVVSVCLSQGLGLQKSSSAGSLHFFFKGGRGGAEGESTALSPRGVLHPSHVELRHLPLV